MISQRALTVIVFVITGLLVVVVLAGLYQNQLDATGIALTLSSVLTGLVAGQWRRKSRAEEKTPPAESLDE